MLCTPKFFCAPVVLHSFSKGTPNKEWIFLHWPISIGNYLPILILVIRLVLKSYKHYKHFVISGHSCFRPDRASSINARNTFPTFRDKIRFLYRVLCHSASQSEYESQGVWCLCFLLSMLCGVERERYVFYTSFLGECTAASLGCSAGVAFVVSII